MFHMHAIRAVYPCARFVHVLRHPLDLAANELGHVGNRAAETLRVAHALGYRGTSQGGAVRFLCAADDACRALVSPMLVSPTGRPLVPVLPNSATTTKFKRRVEASQPLAAALQCMHLLLWSAVNNLTVRWATSVGLAREGALLLYQSDAPPKALDRLADATRALIDGKAGPLLAPRGRMVGRRLAYGKWHEALTVARAKQLEHCGPWRQTMGELGMVDPEYYT
jgi:hypothetical protein